MNQPRTCIIKDHTNYVTCICISLKCKEKIRLLCSSCLRQDLHNHDDGPKQNYIIEINNNEELERILRQKYYQIQEQIYKKLTKYILIMKQAIDFLQQSIEQAQKHFQFHFDNSFSILKNIVSEKTFNIENILKLDNTVIDKVLNISPSILDFNSIDDIMQMIQQGIQMVNEKKTFIQSKTIMNNLQEIQQRKIEFYNGMVENVVTQLDPNIKIELTLPNQNIFQENNHLNEQMNILIDSQYSRKVIHQSKKDFYHAEISPNEQYIVYGGKDSILFIYDLNSKTVKNEYLNHFISVCRFTQDSKFLFVGCNLGFLYIYQIDNSFQQLSISQYYFQDWVINIYPISSQEIILSSENSYVIRSYIQNKVEPLKIYCKDQGSIFCLEYNKDLDIIIVAGEGKFIIALDGKSGNSLISKPYAHENKISQMQLIQNDRLITLDSDGKFKWWNINYTQKILQEIRSYHDPSNRSCGFYGVLDKQYLLLISENSINVIDQDNQIMIKQIEFSESKLFKFRQIHQLNTLKYILVPCEKQLILLSR